MLRAIMCFIFRPFAKWILKRELRSSELKSESIAMLNKENIKLKQQQRSIGEILGNIRFIIQSKISTKIINVIELTKFHELVIVQFNIDLNDGNLYLYNLEHKRSISNSHLSFSLTNSLLYSNYYQIERILQVINITIQRGEVIIVDEIWTQLNDRRKGYASVLFHTLFGLAKQHGFKTIIGLLAKVDQEAWPTLKNFYQSLGFETYIVPDLECGAIIKHLE